MNDEVKRHMRKCNAAINGEVEKYLRKMQLNSELPLTAVSPTPLFDPTMHEKLTAAARAASSTSPFPQGEQSMSAISFTEGPVRVRYQHDQRTWEMVVEAGGSSCDVIEENMNDFVVEYPSRSEFESELARFDGMIAYQEIPGEEQPS